VGARLLRTYARPIGLDPGFTIHDREDSADLMNLVRHELGLSERAERFPLKGTCLGIYSRTVNAALSDTDLTRATVASLWMVLQHRAMRFKIALHATSLALPVARWLGRSSVLVEREFID
jgi:hypothetical protein